MKQYNFDEIIDRKGTGALKIDLCDARFGSSDLLPLWVADMDFRTPDFIMESIRQRANHEVLGYTIRTQEYFDSIIRWMDYRFNWTVEKQWIGFVPGIVPGIAFAINAFSDKGDNIIVQPPVYPPFMSVPSNNGREVRYNPLNLINGQFEIDFNNFENCIDSKTRIFILCNPHNPGGKVWKTTDLERIAEICKRHNILVVSDEIHADMILSGHKHCPFPTVSDDAYNNCITFMAPSKTFNMAGLASSSYIIPNPEIRKIFSKYIESLEIGSGNIFAFTATIAAYNNGAEWLNQMLSYVEGNIQFVDEYLKKNLPKIHAVIPEASFLIWLDFRELNLSNETLRLKLIRDAHLAFNDGASFGPGGDGFQRINIGCSRLILSKAMDRLYNTFKNI